MLAYFYLLPFIISRFAFLMNLYANARRRGVDIDNTARAPYFA